MDRLEREHSAIDGELPMLLSPGVDPGADLLTMLFHADNDTTASRSLSEAGGSSITGDASAHSEIKDAEASSSNVQFGADQVILVYNETQRERVQQIAGDNALVLTVQQCKGLEFQVCLLLGDPDLMASAPFNCFVVPCPAVGFTH